MLTTGIMTAPTITAVQIMREEEEEVLAAVVVGKY